MKKLVLLDAHAIIHRAFHALPLLTSPSGAPTNAVYGFTTILMRILREFKPDYIAACFDLPGPTFRHEQYAAYKATRPETPADLIGQFMLVKEMVRAYNISVFEKEGYEADDIIGTIAVRATAKKDMEVIIVTGDMDLLQLVNDRVKCYSMRKGITDTVMFDEEGVYERYGLTPRQIVDYKALKGDPSDNIAGVRGIGEKTALALIREFGSLEEIYRAVKKGDKKIPTSVATKLIAGDKDAYISRDIATIHTSVPIEFDLAALERHEEKSEQVRAVLHKLGFFSILKRLDAAETTPPTERKQSSSVQTGLFDAQTGEGAAPFSCEEIKIEKEFFSFAARAGEHPGLIFHEGVLFVVAEDGRVCRPDQALFSRPKIRKWLGSTPFTYYDAKAVIHALHPHGASLKEAHDDLMIASWLTQSFSRDFSYGAVLGRELGRPALDDMRGEFVHLHEVAALLQNKVSAMNMERVYRAIELPITRILVEMELRGVLVDTRFLKRLAGELEKQLAGLIARIYRAAGEEFNINSTRQLSRVLFDKLGISVRGLRKTEKGGVVSTGASELEKLRGVHMIIADILDYRELMKLKTTYVDALPALVNKETGRLHTTFNQTGTSTGRLSSSNPNLQNIPVISEYGRKVREAFIAPKGFALVSFDYSQIELRIAAHLARDARMIEAFRNGEDIHRMTAAEVNGVSLGDVTAEQRRAAKTLNFGVLYGMGHAAFAEQSGMPRLDAKRFIDSYFRKFSGVRNYLEHTKQFVEEHGYVETLFGRRRIMPEIHSSSWQLKREQERMAINMPIQGTAADLVKMAMVGVDRWITNKKLHDDVRLILQIHDELLFEVKKKRVAELAPIIKHIMEEVAKLDVPLGVEVKAGANWNEQTPH